MIGLDRHAVFDEMDRERRMARQQLVHEALEVRRQVLNDHERHAGVLRQVIEEAHERIEPARRRADADDKTRRHRMNPRAGLVRRGCVRVARRPLCHLFTRHSCPPKLSVGK